MTRPHNLTARELSRQIHLDVARFELEIAAPDDIVPARALAAALISPAIASAEGLARVHAHRPAVFVARAGGEVTGVLAFVILNPAGLEAVMRGRFDTVEPAAAHLAADDEIAAGVYGWGVCAADKPSAQKVVEACKHLNANALASLPQFARTATEAGRRLMYERLGFVDLPGSGGLVWAPPRGVAVALAEPAAA